MGVGSSRGRWCLGVWAGRGRRVRRRGVRLRVQGPPFRAEAPLARTAPSRGGCALPAPPRPSAPTLPWKQARLGQALAEATSRAWLKGAKQVPPPPTPPGRCDPAPAATLLLATGPAGRDLDAPPRPRNQWARGQPGGRGGRGLGDAETGAGGEREPTGRTDHGLQVSQVRQDRVLR